MSTSIKISLKNRDKLQKLKRGRNMSYDSIITEILDHEKYTMDCETIDRQKVAFQLQYFSYDTENLETYDVSFYELSNCKVGDIIEVPHKYNDSLYYSEKALIVFKDDVSAIVRIESIDFTGKSVIEDSRLLNVVFY